MGSRRKWVLGVVAVAVLATGGVFAWQRLRSPAQPPAAVPPEVPAAVVDEEVRGALTAARNKVLAEPHSGQAWGELGLTFRAHSLNAESNACFAEAAKLDPQNPRWPYLIGLINLLVAPADAVPHLRTAHDLAAEPEYKSAARLRLAEALLDRGEPAEAEKLFGEDARTNPLNPRTQFGLGAAAFARGDHEKAVNHLTAAASSPFARRKAGALLAACHRQLGNVADAERYEREASRGPEDLPWPDPFITEYMRRETGRSARMKEVEQLEAQGRIAEAVLALEKFALSNPDDQVLVSLGINLSKLGNFPRAEQALRVVVARSPNHAVARYFLGIALYMQAEQTWKAGATGRAEPQFKEAVKELRRAVELKPDQGLAHLYAGLALKHLGNLPEAADECRAAIRASPQFADTHLGLGEVLVEMNKPTEAVPHLETAARLAPPGDKRAKTLLDKIAAKKP